MTLTSDLENVLYPSTPFNLHDNLILLGRRGSESHGLFVPSTNPDSIDDRDLMGIVVPPAEYYLGRKSWEGAEEINGVWDVALYELRKFVGLLCKQNPNVLSLLWLEDRDYLTIRSDAQPLLVNRMLFRHQGNARNAFVGYAHGQLKRMTAFDRESMQVISNLEAELLDHGINLAHAAEGKLHDEEAVIQSVVDRYVGMRRTYHKAYMGAKRWSLVQKVGYDAKNAAHMIRLLHMGHEYLTEGVVHVRREWDRDMLLEIKHGEWPLEEVKEHAEHWFEQLQTVKSGLPTSIDEDEVDEMLEDIIMSHLGLIYT